MVMPQKKTKPKPKPVINYPPLTLRKWIPPYLRPKKKRKPKWTKPPGINHPIPISTLVKVWRNFKYVEDGDFYVLHGSFSERSPRYGIRRGCQGMSVCMAAITYSKTVKMSKWSRHVIDDMMDVGNRVYHESVIKTSDRTKCQIEKSELLTTFYLGDTKIMMTTKGGLFEGKLFGDYPEGELLGSVLGSFLSSGYESGIICAGPRFMAIWSSGSYYLFDPGDHGNRGEIWNYAPGRGVSVVIKSDDVGLLAKLATEYFGQKVNTFEIMPCSFFSTTKYDKRSPDTLEEYLASVKKIPVPSPERVPPPRPALPAPPEPIIEEPPTAPDYNNLPEEEVMPEGDAEIPEVPQWKKPIEKPPLEPVSYFIDMKSANLGILRGTTHQCDPRFTRLNGLQTLANAIAAITMLRFYKSRNWIPRIVDEVLKLGDWIYNESLKDLPKNETLTLDKICKRITLNNQDFTADVKEWFALGQLQSKIEGVFNLTNCLKTFFADNDACLITRPVPIAVWYEDRRYYMFNPNSCDHLGQISLNGLACVTWYKNLADLVETFTQNLVPALQRDQFFLNRVIIKDYIDLPEDWFNFTVVTPSKWILQGDFSIKDKRFEKEHRNIQFTAVAIMALTYQQNHLMEDWDLEYINDILEQGHQLHKTTIEYLTEMGRFSSNILRINEIKRKFLFEGNQIVIDTEELYTGLIDAKDENDVLNLKQAMYEFYRKCNTIGLVTAKSSVVAFWQHQDSFFYLDPYNRDEKGLPTTLGRACCIRVLTIEDLVSVIESNFAPQNDNNFAITRISLAVWEVSEDGIARPPVNNYTEIDPDTAILRSTYSVNSDYFKLNTGKQLIPMSYVALGMPIVYPPDIFDINILDKVLVLGDKLYTDTIIERSKQDLPDEEDNDIVTVDNCIRNFDIGFNNFSINYQNPIEGNFEDDFVEAVTTYINSNMSEDFTDNQMLITCDYYTVAISKNNGIFYLFDASPRDFSGQYIGKDDWSLKRKKKPKPLPPPPEETEEEVVDEEDEDDETERVTNITDLRKEDEDEDEEDEMVEEEEEEDEWEEYEPKEKHSESYWAEYLKDGRACIVRFILADKLVNFMLENTPPNSREELTFKLYPVKAENTLKIKQTLEQLNTKQDQYSGNWYDWQEMDHGFWILQGTIDQSSELFPLPNRGNQQMGNAFAALAYSTLYALKEFKSSTVDSILRYGDRICSVTFRAFGKVPYDYGVTDTVKMFCIGIYQVEITVDEKEVEGHLRADETSEILNVNRALETFFAGNKYGVFDCKGLAMAIWKGANLFYMFDPYQRGPNACQNPNGVACISRYLQLKDMGNVIVNNMPEDGTNSFAIHKCTIESRICPRPPKPDEFIKQDTKPSGFELAVPGKFILRGTIHQNDKKFGRYENTLSAPIAIVALTMTLIHKTETWTKLLVDEILIIGNELYQQTLDTLGLQFNPWDQGMNIHLVSRMYNIGTLSANCELRNNYQTGIIDTKAINVLNLRRALELFFTENTHGVIESETLTVAVWEELDHPGYIFMFDPNPRGPAGLLAINGVACVLKIETIKLAVEHFIANVDKDKRQGGFVITPVEIVVGQGKHKGIVDNVNCKKKNTKGDVAKKRAREKAEAEMKERLAMRLTKMGRMAFYDLGNGVAILRGSKSQTSKDYSTTSRGNQDIPNCFIAYIVNKLVPISEWQFRHIDTILDAGDQLYKDSYITYMPRKPKLGLQNVLREVVIKDVYVSLMVYKPVIREELNAYNLEVALINVFQQEKFCLITNSHEWVAVFFCAGYYYLFDPHDNDISGERCKYNGTACVLRYESMRSMISRYINNINIDYSTNMFTLVLIGINSIKKMQTTVAA